MNDINIVDPFEREHAILSTLPIFQPKYTSFFRSSLEGRNVDYLQSSPLLFFKEKMNDSCAHFHGFGKELVKGANLAFRSIFQEGKELTELDFKINHVFRASIQQKLDELTTMDRHVLNALLDRSESLGKNIQIEHGKPFPIGDSSMGYATAITLKGLGTLFICTSPEFPSIYNRIVVQMEQGKEIGDFHAILAFINLENSLKSSNLEDQMRHKLGHLFRTFFPRVAFHLERSFDFFTLPIEEIKSKIVCVVPEMKSIFDRYLDQMTLEELLPGRMRYRINGLAKQAYDLGARGLTSAIRGAWGTTPYERTASILHSGMLSLETRKFLNLSFEGLSSSSDFYSGGSDVVYTQMITEDNCRKNVSFSHLQYFSNIRLLISLEALETGTYQYFNDAYGNRDTSPNAYWGTHYTKRPGILEFIEGLQESTVLFLNRDKILRNVENPNLFEEWELLEKEILRSLTDERGVLEEMGLIRMDADGSLKILGMNVIEFLHLTKQSFFHMNHKKEMIHTGHELMIKERIDPKFIKKILVANEDVKKELIHHLEASGLIQENTILGHPVGEFILVEGKASEALFV